MIEPITPLSLLPALLGLDVLGVLSLPLTRLFAPFEVEPLGVWAERLLVFPDERLPPLPEGREGPLALRAAVVPLRAAAALLGVPPREPESPVADLLRAVLAPLLALFPARDAD